MILWFYALPNNTIPLPLVFFTLRLWRSSGYIIRYFLSPDWKERGKTWPEFSAPLCLLQDSDITAPLKCIENSDLPEDSPCLWSVLDSARDTDHIQTLRVTTGAGHVKLWGMQSPVLPAQHPFPVMDPDTGTSCLHLPHGVWLPRTARAQFAMAHQGWEFTQSLFPWANFLQKSNDSILPLCEAAPPSSAELLLSEFCLFSWLYQTARCSYRVIPSTGHK